MYKILILFVVFLKQYNYELLISQKNYLSLELLVFLYG